MPFLVMSASTTERAREVAISVRKHGHGIGVALLPQARMTAGSFTAVQATTSTPFLRSASALLLKLGRCFRGTHRGEGAGHGEECDALSLEKLVRADLLHTAFP